MIRPRSSLDVATSAATVSSTATPSTQTIGLSDHTLSVQTAVAVVEASDLIPRAGRHAGDKLVGVQKRGLLDHIDPLYRQRRASAHYRATLNRSPEQALFLFDVVNVQDPEQRFTRANALADPAQKLAAARRPLVDLCEFVAIFCFKSVQDSRGSLEDGLTFSEALSRVFPRMVQTRAELRLNVSLPLS